MIYIAKEITIKYHIQNNDTGRWVFMPYVVIIAITVADLISATHA